eukprot:120192_1
MSLSEFETVMECRMADRGKFIKRTTYSQTIKEITKIRETQFRKKYTLTLAKYNLKDHITMYFINIIETIQVFGFTNVIKAKDNRGKYRVLTKRQKEKIKFYLIIHSGHLLKAMSRFYETEKKEELEKEIAWHDKMIKKKSKGVTTKWSKYKPSKGVTKIMILTQSMWAYRKQTCRSHIQNEWDTLTLSGSDVYLNYGEDLLAKNLPHAQDHVLEQFRESHRTYMTYDRMANRHTTSTAIEMYPELLEILQNKRMESDAMH